MFEPQFCIDWFTFTYPTNTLTHSDDDQTKGTITDIRSLTASAKGLLRYVLGAGDDLAFTPSYPRYGMRLSLKTDSGATIHFCPTFPSPIDCVTVLPGDTLVHVRTLQGSTRSLATRAIHKGARCTRLDVAIDVFEGDIETYIKDAGEHITGHMRRKATVLRPLDDLDGTTLYVGSRKSSRMLRIYQKDKQLQVDIGCPWIRIELEAKRKVSRAMFKAYANGGMAVLVADIVSRYHFNGEVWNSLLWYANPGKEARRILVENTQGKATKSTWVLRHIAAIAEGIDQMTLNVFLTALATRASTMNLTGLMTDVLTLV